MGMILRMSDEEAWTTADAMKFLKIRDPDTLYALVTSGRLPATKLGRTYRFEPEAVRAFRRGERLSAVRSAASASRHRGKPAWMKGVREAIH